MSSNLPLLPGHRFNDPYQQNYHKNQVFNFKTKTCLEKPNLTEVIDPYTISGLSILTSSVTSDRLKNRDTTLNESYPRILPQWIKNDKKVLRFNCYFVEHVVESAYENYRIRKCDIYYYLDDDTIHITEVREENSGIPQGYFLKRHKIEKVSGSQNYISYRDFNLRSEILIYGKKFRICDCDDFTKKFYSDNNIPLNPSEAIPKIPGDDKFANVDMVANGNKIGELKEYIEVKLGGGHPNKILKQFLDNDRKVLNFDIVWYDEKYDKEEKFYKLHYFLSNGNVEIREIKINNSGKDPFPLLLRKSKLPKKPVFTYCPGLDVKPEEYYKPEDLKLGNYIYVFNRNCLICDCDEFTKNWYKQNLNIDVTPVKIKKNPPQKVIHPIPPHNSIGSEEDSLLSVYFLRPVARIKDMNKMFKADKHILRFSCKLISSVPADEERKFLLSVYARDDTIMVYELADKNSGRIPCKFMERKKHKNPFTKKYYIEKDFAIGNTIYLNSFIFKLLDSDEYTKKYMRENPEIFTDSNMQAIVARIRLAANKLSNYEEFLVEVLRSIDPTGKVYVSKESLIEGFKNMGIFLNIQESNTILECLRMNDEGNYSAEDLFEILNSF